jgi:hypothetical protein
VTFTSSSTATHFAGLLGPDYREGRDANYCHSIDFVDVLSGVKLLGLNDISVGGDDSGGVQLFLPTLRTQTCPKYPALPDKRVVASTLLQLERKFSGASASRRMDGRFPNEKVKHSWRQVFACAGASLLRQSNRRSRGFCFGREG